MESSTPDSNIVRISRDGIQTHIEIFSRTLDEIRKHESEEQAVEYIKHSIQDKESLGYKVSADESCSLPPSKIAASEKNSSLQVVAATNDVPRSDIYSPISTTQVNDEHDDEDVKKETKKKVVTVKKVKKAKIPGEKNAKKQTSTSTKKKKVEKEKKKSIIKKIKKLVMEEDVDDTHDDDVSDPWKAAHV